MEWKKRNAQLEQEVQNLKNKVTRLETYNETFEKKIKDLTDEIVNARHKIAQLEAQNDEAQRNIEAQQKEVRLRPLKSICKPFACLSIFQHLSSTLIPF